MIPRVSLCIVASAAILCVGGLAARGASQFGDRIELRSDVHQPFLVGDFDGQGATDKVFLVRIAAASTGKSIAKDVVVEGFWRPSGIAAEGEPLALLIVNGKSGRAFLIHGRSYFDSPIWHERQLPLHVAPRGSKAAHVFSKHVRSMRNDVLVLGTEAGIDTAVYFDGLKYALFEPNEEP